MGNYVLIALLALLIVKAASHCTSFPFQSIHFFPEADWFDVLQSNMHEARSWFGCIMMVCCRRIAPEGIKTYYSR